MSVRIVVISLYVYYHPGRSQLSVSFLSLFFALFACSDVLPFIGLIKRRPFNKCCLPLSLIIQSGSCAFQTHPRIFYLSTYTYTLFLKKSYLENVFIYLKKYAKYFVMEEVNFIDFPLGGSTIQYHVSITIFLLCLKF